MSSSAAKVRDDSKDKEFDGSLLKKTLDDVDPFGTFAAFGDVEPKLFSPLVVVSGYGEVSLPLKPESAEVLKGLASKSPYGRGPETLYDDNVRKCWQFEPDSVEVVCGTEWNEMFDKILLDASYGLGLSNESVKKMGMKANLYKVLLYEEGGHFKPHRDTEKEEGMFASLVIQLPSSFKGGGIRVSHQGETMTLESCKDCNRLLKYSAFYSDCMHELLPVTEGWRMCLVYNVVCSAPEEAPDLKAFARENATQETLNAVCKDWCESKNSPDILGYSLDHCYTLDRCGFDDLKGRDRVVATVIRDAKGEDGSPLFDVRLVVFYLHATSGRGDAEEPDGGVRVVMDKDGKEVPETTLEGLMYVGDDGLFRTYEDLSEARQELVEEDDRQFIPEYIGDGYGDKVFSVFQRGWSVEKVDHHFAGNEGGGKTTWYRSAALVFKPATKSGDSEW